MDGQFRTSHKLKGAVAAIVVDELRAGFKFNAVFSLVFLSEASLEGITNNKTQKVAQQVNTIQLLF